MNKLISRIILFYVTFSFLSGAQTLRAQDLVLKGRVISEESSSPVPGVVVSLHAKDNEKVLAYGLTDGSGYFSLPIAGDWNDLVLTASSMMTETISLPVSISDDEICIKVKEKKLAIRESKVQASKVSMRGDTLSYNVASFLKADDRSIGEVLKRLPGIKVNSDGEIFYQNLQINKFYVEGLDLLQGRYGLATNNIDPNMVATIQILENHQPIRVLKDMEIPQQAAINIKLKRSAQGAFFLTAQAGLGLSPLLFSNELLGMRFTNSEQSLMLYKNDNTGRDIASEMTSFYGTATSPLLTFFSPEVLSAPSIDKKHFLFNNANLISFNDLKLLKKGFTLTGNANFLIDRQRKTGFWQQTVIDPKNRNIVVAEDLSSKMLKRELTGTIALEKNEDDRYINNRTDANIAWNRQDCTIASGSPISQKAELPSFIVENQFAYKTAKDRFSSHLLFSWQDNSLAVSPIMLQDLKALDDYAEEQVKYGRLELDFRYYRNIRLSRRLSLDLNLRPFIKDMHFTSGFLSGADRSEVKTDSLRNDLLRTELGADVEGDFRYQKRSFTAQLNASGQYLYLSRDNHVSAKKLNHNIFLLVPSAYVEYKKRNLIFRLDASYRQGVSDISNDFSGYNMSSYRSFSRSDGTFSRYGRFSIDAGIHYKDISSTLFSSLTAGYSRTHRNTLGSLNYDGILCQTSEMKYDNSSDYWWVNLESGKDIRALSSTVKLDSRFSHSKSLTLYQGRIVDYAMSSIEIAPSWYALLGGVASISYEADYSLSKSVVDEEKNRILHNLRQSLEVSIAPFKNANIKVAGNHYYNSSLPSERSHWFMEMGLGYKYKKTEWMLDWTNIFNTKELVSYYYDQMSSYCSRYGLRPMEILLRVKFNIL